MLVASLLDPANLADIYELRLDLPRKTPVIFTLRSQAQGGHFQGSESARLEILRALLILQPDFVDLEWDTDPRFIAEVAQLYPQVKLLISYHNYASTPLDLDAIFAAMHSQYAYAYKIATFAQSSLDALRMLAWIKKQRGQKVTGICLGPYGEITRILGKTYGNFFSYASLGDNKVETSQLPVSLLQEKYRFQEILAKQYALLGGAVEKSISPYVHNEVFKQLSLPALYTKLSLEDFTGFFPLASELGFAGFSVTMPLKEKILPFLDYIAPEAQTMRAVNTVKREDGQWKGYNTDGQGALNALEKKIPVRGKKILILGSGGTAKAIGYESAKRGALVHYLSRAAKTGQTHTFDILINATPSPLPVTLEHPGTSQQIVMDVNMLPIMSPFLQRAHDLGYTLVFGYEMFAEQAVLQYNIWENISLDAEIVKKIWLAHARNIPSCG